MSEPNGDNIDLALVDDNPDWINITSDYLTKLNPNFNINSFTSPNEFLTFIQKPQNNNKIKIIVSDYIMPELNGIDFFNRLKYLDIRFKEKYIPFILVSGESKEKLFKNALESGIDYCVEKHADTELMYSELHNFIMKASKTIELEIKLDQCLKNHKTTKKKRK